jgi:sugar phosphate isomerase/epimerase
MAAISRREFFKKTTVDATVAAILASGVARLRANPLGLPIGSQTYPHAARIKAGEFAQLMKDMKAAGIDQVELCDPWNYVSQGFDKLLDGKTTKKMLDDAGIKAISCHVGMKVYRTQHKDVLNWAHDVGLTQLSTADLGGTTKDGKTRMIGNTTTVDWIKEAADEYNAIAKVSKAAGLLQVLHNEGFCNSRTADGRMTYPILIENLDPALVGMQFQMSSMPSVGNPITYFTIYPGRFWSAHMQGVDAGSGMRAAALPPLPDKNAPAGRGGGGAPAAAGRAAGAPAAGAPAGTAPGGAPPAGAPPAAGAGAAGGGRGRGLSLGEDTVDWPKVFEAAKVGGMKNFFIEQAWDLTVKSAAYLKTIT